MPFSIQFPPDATEETDENQRFMAGRKTLGDFREEFLAHLDYWTPKQYEAQWRDAVLGIVSGKSVDALITDMHDLRTAHHLVSWPMYREGDRVFVQNRLLFLNDLGRPQQLEDLIPRIGNRRTINDEGAQISEWDVGVSDLLAFLWQSHPVQ